MQELILSIIQQGGYFGIAVLMALENVIPPIPSEVIMGLGGMLVERGDMAFWLLLLAGTVGSTFGNYVWFWLGQKWGYERLEPFINRWGRWLTLDWEHIEQANRFFRKHGHWVVLFLRFAPFLRTMISLPAGLSHMPLGKFLAFTFVGTAIWNVALIYGGQLLGRYFQGSQDVLAWLIIGLLALGALFYLWRVFTWVPHDQRDGQG
ncbi:DedA family protein [Altericroceibacterium endophyticum]|uniref:DedA family protein n=1 Tax=Altericroceibacterium endophyticum TaxID=1808508 RepID=A0A6I4T047_9SPHN|nr:DedA family protein [Altericroceibacterium endophyticum]MXO64454.1 DedA family protein [Altericroceibacterium endophyticum]